METMRVHNTSDCKVKKTRTNLYRKGNRKNLKKSSFRRKNK